MSYDLMLHTRPGKPPLTREAFAAHFQGDRWKVEGDTASYFNEVTGVYFQFGYSDGKPDVDEETPATNGEAPTDAGEDAEPSQPYIWFNINYFRPHYFGLEAQGPLARLVKTFNLVVSDPQNEGMGEGEFTPEGFLRGWNAGNRFAFQALLQMKDETPIHQMLTVPAELNRQIWEWNYHRELLGNELFDEGTDVFVPRVMFLHHAGRVQTVCVWPNLIPSALPQTDLVLVTRDKLPEEFEELQDPVPSLLPWETVRKAGENFEVIRDMAGGSLDYLLLDYGTADDAPEELTEFLASLSPLEDKLQGISPDEVLDAELVEQYRPKA